MVFSPPPIQPLNQNLTKINMHLYLLWKILTVTTARSTRLFLETSLLSGTIGLLTEAVVVNKSLIGWTTKNWAVIITKLFIFKLLDQLFELKIYLKLFF